MKSTNPWLRLYAEFATDPKVQMMSESDQRRLVMLFCVRCSNGDETLHDSEVAFQLRVSIEEWKITKAVFEAKGFIDTDNNLLNWNERQYISDSSTVRVKKHRDKKKHKGNVPVTPPEADTDADKSSRSVESELPDPPRNYPSEPDGARATSAGRVCKALRTIGIAHVNPSHASLIELLGSGTPEAMFADTARELSERGAVKFNYLLATIRGRLADAARAPPVINGARAGPPVMGKQAQGVAAIQRLRDEIRNDERPDPGADATPDVRRLRGTAGG